MDDTVKFGLIIGIVVVGAIILGLMYLPKFFHGVGGSPKSVQKTYRRMQGRVNEINAAISRLESKRFLTKNGREQLDRLRRDRSEMETTMARIEQNETARMRGEQ